MKELFKKIFLIFTLALCSFSFVQAQYLEDSIVDIKKIYITVNPANPRPGQTITVSVGANTIKLETASISWYLNDTLKSAGLGVKQFTFDTNKNGIKDIVRVIVKIDGFEEEITREILATEIDMIIENDSYTMPFYKGRSTFSTQGTTRIVAISNIIKDGVRVPEKDLLFKWRKENKVLQSSSGVGKNTLSITGSVPIKDIDVEVEVSTLDGSIKAERRVYYSTGNPKLLLYENSPIYGLLFNKTVSGTYNLKDEEIVIDAFPFGFSVFSEQSTDLNYKWFVNNAQVALEEAPNKLTLRQTGKGSGFADVSITIENKNKIFQFNSGSFMIQFSK